MTVIPLSHRLSRSMQKYAIGYLFIAVPLLSLIVFLFIPMVVSFWWSLNDYSGLTGSQICWSE